MIYGLILLLSVGVDQLVKFLAVQYLRGTEGVALIPGVLHLTYVENRGAAFGILQEQTVLFAVVTGLVIAAVIGYVWWRRPKSRMMLTSLALIVGGAVGNLIDRLRLSYVVDMIDVRLIRFPVFNVADSCIVVGTVLLCVYVLFLDGRTRPTPETDGKEER